MTFSDSAEGKIKDLGVSNFQIDQMRLSGCWRPAVVLFQRLFIVGGSVGKLSFCYSIKVIFRFIVRSRRSHVSVFWKIQACW